MVLSNIGISFERNIVDKGFVTVFISKKDEVGVARERKQNDKAKTAGQHTKINSDISSINKIGSNITIEVNGVPDRKRIDDCDSNQEVSHDVSEAVKHGHLFGNGTILGNISLDLGVLKAELL